MQGYPQKGGTDKIFMVIWSLQIYEFFTVDLNMSGSGKLMELLQRMECLEMLIKSLTLLVLLMIHKGLLILVDKMEQYISGFEVDLPHPQRHYSRLNYLNNHL